MGGHPRIRRFVFACALLPSCSCNNGGATLVSNSSPASPSDSPSITVTSVVPAAGATPFFTVTFTLTAGRACGQGLLLGGALTLDDGTIQDSADANGHSGLGPFPVDPTCSQSGTSAAQLPQRAASLDNVLHVKAITLYLSPPVTMTADGTYPAITSAVATSRYATDLYVVAEPLVVGGAGSMVGGSWTGAVQDGSAGAGTASLSIRQSGTQLLGDWSFNFGQSASNVSGNLVGYSFPSAVTLMLTPAGGTCPIVWRMNLGAGSSGVPATYAPASGCSLKSSGTGVVSKAP